MNDVKLYDPNFAEQTINTWLLLRQTWIAVNKVAETKLAKIGLTPEKAAVLWACRDFPGTLTPAEIARLLFRENQTIAGLLNRMEKDGLVTRVPKRRGHPFTEIRITDKGKEKCGPCIEIYKNVILGFSSDMPAGEREHFEKTLRKLILKMLDNMHIEAGRYPCDEGNKPLKVNW